MATVTDIHIIYADFLCCLGIKCNLWAVFFIAIFNTSGKTVKLHLWKICELGQEFCAGISIRHLI